MPIREELYDDKVCEAFFGGLLPESKEARKALAHQYGIDPESTFSMLKAIGGDCAGAVSLHEDADIPMSPAFGQLEGEALPEAELAKLIRNLPRSPLFSGRRALRLSLAGYQNKAAVCVINGEVCLPKSNFVPTTHILKPAHPVYQSTCQNEYFCMKLAERMGLPVAKVELRSAEDLIYLLVERYDREIDESGIIHRVHQEDFCQALGVVSENKYESEGGPGLKDCFELLARYSDKPAADRNQLMSNVIFNYLIGNADAHAKNFSLLHLPSGLRLSMLYDLNSTLVYEELSTQMAMKIGGESSFLGVTQDNWKAEAKRCKLGFPALRNRMKANLAMIEQEAELLEKELDNPVFETYIIPSIVMEMRLRLRLIKELWNLD